MSFKIALRSRPGPTVRLGGLLLTIGFLLLLGAAVGRPALAQSATDASPLRPVETASPRDTLEAFLTNTRDMILATRAGAPIVDRYRLARAAMETMDFGTDASNASWSERIRKQLLLYDILARLDLPPPERIPGPEMVAVTGLSSWTAPGSRIMIARQDSGERQGEFLFTAPSIGRLDLYHRRVGDLPHKPGMLAIREFGVPDLALDRDEVIDRLHGLDTSSPRATLEGFLESMNEAYRIQLAAEIALNRSETAISHEEADVLSELAFNHLMRAVTALDLSEVPALQQEDVGIEAALKLKEVLDRVFLPPVDSVPDLLAIGSAEDTEDVAQWRFPGTKIEINRIEEGERAGDYVFSAGTVARIGDIYDRLKDLPYRAQEMQMVIGEFRSIATSDGFYEDYISTPGYLVPSAHMLTRFIADLPDWLKTLYGGQTLWQWVGLALVTGLAIGAIAVAFWIVHGVAAKIARPAGRWLVVLAPLLSIMVVRAAIRVLDHDFNLTGDLVILVQLIGGLTVVLLTAWTAWCVAVAASTTLIASTPISSRGIDASLVRVVARIIGFVVAVVIVVDGLQDLGADLVTIAAGLGVGGLAVALAIRPTMGKPHRRNDPLHRQAGAGR